ncbi:MULTISPECIES: class I SAM-dependent methyltransferase [unclassified Okeania]|uniref:class I SAM-dependent DNA methyltransferase n=1 Tax=unclassified Okeania TaxID=2634635 RepID=UPI0013BB2CDB|nr:MULTISPECIES: class I SAM-dependent methyltransferase [unclassified Okeania]NES76175.1 class I SAM-dependent methyltransferase [Okeania sp. SIO1H4]NET14254.1 class I SAM-dependent methyltransferase [Okeania sp. SIO1H6]NET19378.1 class I SAM-dependent methyltransferase [Okeania sp. SIO1H5]NET93261.1 class I SAM-dependent methyltransferase [Okeania sp. SIO1H2]
MLKKTTAEEFYDAIASDYDDILESDKCDARHVNEAVKIFHRYNHHQGNILDIGCGTGMLSQLLEGNFEYTGIDISNEMLNIASKRGYQTICKPLEIALAEVDTDSYDFVFCLSSLLCIEDVGAAIIHMRRIARKTILISLDEVSQEFIQKYVIPVFDHSQFPIEDAVEDYFIAGWTSPTIDMSVQTRMIYIEQNNHLK